MFSNNFVIVYYIIVDIFIFIINKINIVDIFIFIVNKINIGKWYWRVYWNNKFT